MRSGIAFSSFQTAYWLYYNTVFVPTVNASPMEQLHIDPTLGVAGMVFAIAIQAVFFVYPTRLVSKLEYCAIGGGDDNKRRQQQDDELLRIYTHTLPFVNPSDEPAAVLRVGQIRLDPSSTDTETILNDHGGDMAEFRGHVALGVSPDSPAKKIWSFLPYMSYLLDIRQPENVPEPELLLQVLIHPDQHRQHPRRRKADGDAGVVPIKKKSSRGPSRKRRESQLQKIVRKRK